MLTQILIRLLVGGAIVSLFAIIGDVLKPKSFAGLFGAAPSVALATIALTVKSEGSTFASIEARSMILGALAFFAYAWVVCRLLKDGKRSALKTTLLSLLLWCACALGMWWLILG